MKYSIESERLLLRNFTLEDAEAYFQMTQDDDIKRYLPYTCTNSLDGALSLIKIFYMHGDFVRDFYLVLEEKSTHEFIGAIIATTSRNFSTIDMCLMIQKDYRNRGYMTEALNTFFTTLPAGTLLSFVIEKDNENSLNTVYKIDGIQDVSAFMDPDMQKTHKEFLYRI